MIEGLLAFVTLIAIWKIFHVWILKARVRRKDREIAAVREETHRLGQIIAKRKNSTPEIVEKAQERIADAEWPELFS